MFIGGYFPDSAIPVEFHDKAYNLRKVFKTLMVESGYYHLQATKPDTIGTKIDNLWYPAYVYLKFSRRSGVVRLARRFGRVHIGEILHLDESR